MAVGNSSEVAKTLIEIATTFEDADETVKEYLGSTSPSYSEKLKFLENLFGNECSVNRHVGDSDELIYNVMLNGVINKKWN